MFKRVIVLVFGVVVVACSSALTLKAAIGVGAWDALAQTGSLVTGIEVGTIGMFCNFLCIFVQVAILRRKFKPIQLLQIPVCILLGLIVNFMLYEVYSNFTINTYWMNVGLLILGYIVSAFAVGMVMVLDIVTFALEGACMAVSGVTDVPLAVREGTIIGMFLFGPMMGIFMKLQKPVFKKFGLIDYN